MASDPADLAREYYRALDEHDYGVFEAVLSPEFVHERPDRTFEGRERFVEFMRDERPERETRHRVDAVYHVADGSTGNGSGRTSVAVEGRLFDDEGTLLFEFVDVFSVVDGGIQRVETYTQST